jgi:hypothetical protein
VTAQVVALELRGGLWVVSVARMHELSVPRSPPPSSDLPDDVRSALLLWIGPTRPPVF